MDVATLQQAIVAGGKVQYIAPGARLWAPKHLRRWSAALSDALDGVARIVVVGDSISVGLGPEGSATATTAADPTYRTSGWPAVLRRLFIPTYGDPGEGWMSDPDPGNRITAAGTAAASVVGPREQGFKCPNNSATKTIAAPTCTTLEFWTWDGGGGTSSVTVDGASTGFSLDGGASGSNTFSAGGGTQSGTTWTKHTITGMSSATHTIVFTGPASGAGLFVAGVSCLKQTTGVQVHRMAKTGDTTNNILGFDSGNNSNSGAKARSLAAIGVTPAAHLVIVALGVNDFGGQNTTDVTTVAQPGATPTTYKANIQSIVNQAITAGAAVLLVGEPRQNSANYPSPMTFTEQNYYDQAKAVALATDHCAFLDINDLWGSNVLGQARSFYTAASVHPSRQGHGSIARLIHRAITVPFGENAAQS